MRSLALRVALVIVFGLAGLGGGCSRTVLPGVDGPVDRGQDGHQGPDVHRAEAGQREATMQRDVGRSDAPSPDQWVVPDYDDCSAAKLLTFTSDTLTEQGTTAGAGNSVLLTTTGCTGYSTAGPDLFYKVQLEKGSRYRFKLQSTGFNAAMYLFTSCSSVAATCGPGMGADERDTDQYPEEILFAPPATAEYHLGVGGRTAADAGRFVLTITRELLPANDTCPTAMSLTLVGGYAQVAGDTRKAQNDVELTGLKCAVFDPTADSMPGPDLFYAITLEGGKKYSIDAKPTAGSDYCPAIYVLSDCTLLLSSVLGCNTLNMPGAEAHLDLVAKSTAQYTIGVDSVADGGITVSGPFTLEVKQVN